MENSFLQDITDKKMYTKYINSKNNMPADSVSCEEPLPGCRWPSCCIPTWHKERAGSLVSSLTPSSATSS